MEGSCYYTIRLPISLTKSIFDQQLRLLVEVNNQEQLNKKLHLSNVVNAINQWPTSKENFQFPSKNSSSTSSHDNSLLCKLVVDIFAHIGHACCLDVGVDIHGVVASIGQTRCVFWPPGGVWRCACLPTLASALTAFFHHGVQMFHFTTHCLIFLAQANLIS